MLEADILERTIGASVSWRRSGPRLWRPRRRPTVAGPKVPMTGAEGLESEIEALRAAV